MLVFPVTKRQINKAATIQIKNPRKLSSRADPYPVVGTMKVGDFDPFDFLIETDLLLLASSEEGFEGKSLDVAAVQYCLSL